MNRVIAIAALLFAPAAGFAEPAATGQDKVRCVRSAPDPGSLVRGRTKVCRTEREWRMMRDANRRNADELTTPTGGSRSSG